MSGESKREALLRAITFAKSAEQKASARKAYFDFCKAEVTEQYDARQHRRMIQG